eukprot:Amastigsp_a2385_14.p3 type:complete len:163 gc:universal Amastigsp_a2385_14:630-142(-)
MHPRNGSSRHPCATASSAGSQCSRLRSPESARGSSAARCFSGMRSTTTLSRSLRLFAALQAWTRLRRGTRACPMRLRAWCQVPSATALTPFVSGARPRRLSLWPRCKAGQSFLSGRMFSRHCRACRSLHARSSNSSRIWRRTGSRRPTRGCTNWTRRPCRSP